MLKIGVFGNRNITDKEKVWDEYLKASPVDMKNTIYLYGGASGPQQFILELINHYKEVSTVLFKPWHMLWSKLEFNPIFFYLRNKQIVENADKIIIFTNGEKDSEVYRVIDLCERRNKDFVIIEV